MNSLPEKWLTFSQGLRNANHTQTHNLANIYERFVYEDNLIQRSQAGPKFQKDYKAEYKKMKAKPALFLASPSKVSDDEEVTRVKVLMALVDDELTVGKSYARNGKWVNITIRKVNTLLSMDEDADWQNYLKGELLTKSLSKININENAFIPASMDYDHEMVPKSKDWVKRLNPDSKLLNFNTGRFLVPESQAVNESLKPTEASTDPESSNDSEAESITPLSPLNILQGASPSSKIKGGVLVKSSYSNESSIGVKCDTCGSTVHSTTDHNKFDQFKKETHQRAHFVPRHWMIKEYDWCQELSAQICRATSLKYNLISISQPCDAKYIVQFDDKLKTIFNANKEIILIAPRRNNVYVLDMSSLSPNGACFFAKASESVNWLWNKRLSHLNFKNINILVKQNKVLVLPSLVYSKDKPCTTCKKGKHHRSSFKSKQNFSIRKCLHLRHMDLFGPVSPVSINHKKYTLVIVDEYSGYTWVYFLKKKSQAREIIMSFIRMVENQNDVKVKQIKTHNGTEFRNHELESFCEENGISQNFYSPYIPKQNGVAERKNKTLIEAARIMLNGSIEDTYHVTFNESMEATRFTHTSEDEIGIDDLSRYPFDEFFYEDDPSRQYQTDSDILYYVIPHGHSLSELTQENQVPKVITPNEPDIPHTDDIEEEGATRVKDRITWGGWDKGVGTVSMGASVRECRVREVEFRQENGLGYCWGLLWGLGFWHNRPLGFVKVANRI
uniref:Putative ribonuclease H-like domain-containing protein n=1 Tax=Tanacetum cinerariifolium TaxID=118510 RepID=A0A699H2W8_TANCI|nr:putative ribonuclease H-like domain-containing protein [Tanacetum cinerariifolium]